MLTLGQQLEQIAGLGTFLVGGALAVLSLLAWRRERERRMLVVCGAYLFFTLHGFFVFVEYYALRFGLLPAATVELLEHASAFLILAGLLTFFVVITRW